MELLVAVLAELLLALVLSSALLVAGGLLLGVFGLLAAVAGRRREGAPARPWLRRSRGAALALLLSVMVALALLQTVLLAPVLRQLCARLQDRSGLELRFQSVDASVLRGRMKLREIELTRRDSAGAEAVALRVAELDLDLDLLSLLPGVSSGPRALERVIITGLKGQITQPAGGGDTNKPTPDKAKADRPSFVIRSLELQDASLELRTTAGARTLAVPTVTVRPLRSDHLIYDLLFHADGEGSLGLIAFQVERAADETRWTLRDLPMQRVRERFSELAIGLSGGTVDVSLAARERPTPQLEFGVALRGLQVRAQENAGRGTRAAAALVSLAMRTRETQQLSFTVDIDPTRYEQASTLAETGLRDDIIVGFKNALRSMIEGGLEKRLEKRLEKKDPPGLLRRRAGEFVKDQVKDRAKDAVKRRLETRRDDREGPAKAPRRP